MADPLLEVVQAVPMRCAHCGMATTQDLPCPVSAAHAWETDDAAIVRAVRAWLRRDGWVKIKLLPPREPHIPPGGFEDSDEWGEPE